MLKSKRVSFWVLLCCLPAALCAHAEVPSKPNVILIVLDTLRADHLSCYGHRSTSPCIDALAQDSVKYEYCYSQAPWTTPSIGSMMTSKYPSELQVTDVPNLLQDKYLLVSEILQQNGYRTGGIISHTFLGSEYNFNQGFDFFNEEAIFGTSGITAPAVTNFALHYLRNSTQEPFFLFLHYFDIHNDYLLHGSTQFVDPLNYSGSLYPGAPLWQAKDMAREGSLTWADSEYLRALYESEIAFTDEHLGRLIEGLKRLGMYDDALLIVCADHGEEFMEHGFLGHSHTLYNEQLRVPLLVKYPRSSRRGVFEKPVALLDIAPTVLETAGIAKPEEFRGISLLTTADVFTNRYIFSETSRNGDLRSVVRNKGKMVYDVESKEYMPFDLYSDPRELQVQPMQPRFYDLKRELDTWMRDMNNRRSKSENAVLSESVHRELGTLGYGPSKRSRTDSSGS